jgi:hypothetical protein
MGLMISDVVDTVEREYKGVTFKIGSVTDIAYRTKLNQLLTRAKKMGKKEFSVEEDDLMYAEAAYGTILKGWSGFVVSGQEVPFTKENALDLLTSDLNARRFIQVISEEAGEFDREWNEETVKK